MDKKEMFRSKVLLLIDDDADDQEIFKSALAEVDDRCVVHSANNGFDALQFLSHERVTPDIIFVDLNMPRMDGLQFLKEIKESGILKDIPLIIYTTSSHPNDISKTRELGAVHFVTKPTRYAELRNLLQSILFTSDFGEKYTRR